MQESSKREIKEKNPEAESSQTWTDGMSRTNILSCIQRWDTTLLRWLSETQNHNKVGPILKSTHKKMNRFISRKYYFLDTRNLKTQWNILEDLDRYDSSRCRCLSYFTSTIFKKCGSGSRISISLRSLPTHPHGFRNAGCPNNAFNYAKDVIHAASE